MVELALNAVQEVMFLVIAVALLYVIQYIRGKFGEERWQLIQDIVEDGILFAQQVYKHASGEEKKEAAIQYIVDGLNERGIKVTRKQISGMIEAVLKRLKLFYGEQWR